jgi:D-alanyl-D-alanine carboxypeptidase
MVLTAITGESLDSMLARSVTSPLGLDRTTLTPPDLATPDIHGYGTSVSDGSLIDLTDDVVTFGNGASGGIVSTPMELARIVAAIAAGDLLTVDLAREMRAGSQQSNFTYGLGLAAYETACGLFYGHEGGVNGMATIAMSSVDGSTLVVIGLNLRGAEDPGLPRLAARLICEGA